MALKDTVKVLLEVIEEIEENDWEETTREEREWMRSYQELALEYLKVTS